MYIERLERLISVAIAKSNDNVAVLIYANIQASYEVIHKNVEDIFDSTYQHRSYKLNGSIYLRG